jgi:WD40 repeat protein
MSFAPADVYACAPGTRRGRGTAMGAHAGKGLLVYANGNAVVVRSLRNPGDVRMYTEHRYQTTCAQISPSGEWVASGDVSGAVRVWGLNGDMSLKAEHQPLSGAVDDIQWSLDGQRIVCCGDGKVRAFPNHHVPPP